MKPKIRHLGTIAQAIFSQLRPV